jgi:hypothetical protein
MKDLINSRTLCIGLFAVLSWSCEQQAEVDTDANRQKPNAADSADNETKTPEEATILDEFDGFIDYGSPVIPSQDIVVTESRIEMPVFKTSDEQKIPQETKEPNKAQMATPRKPSD